VEQEGAVRDEGALTAAARATHGGRLVMLRVHVVPEIVAVLEGAVAVCAVVVLIAIVFPELLVVVE
jgi:hypothetical protein